jgi:hypothetical protein
MRLCSRRGTPVALTWYVMSIWLLRSKSVRTRRVRRRSTNRLLARSQQPSPSFTCIIYICLSQILVFAHSNAPLGAMPSNHSIYVSSDTAKLYACRPFTSITAHESLKVDCRPPEQNLFRYVTSFLLPLPTSSSPRNLHFFNRPNVVKQ